MSSKQHVLKVLSRTARAEDVSRKKIARAESDGMSFSAHSDILGYDPYSVSPGISYVALLYISIPNTVQCRSRDWRQVQNEGSCHCGLTGNSLSVSQKMSDWKELSTNWTNVLCHPWMALQPAPRGNALNVNDGQPLLVCHPPKLHRGGR